MRALYKEINILVGEEMLTSSQMDSLNNILTKKFNHSIKDEFDKETKKIEVIINRGKIMNTEVLQMGGKNIEKDIAYVFGVSVFDARSLKEKFASSHKRFCQLNDVYEVSLDDYKLEYDLRTYESVGRYFYEMNYGDINPIMELYFDFKKYGRVIMNYEFNATFCDKGVIFCIG
jgi:hypothetical protein